MIKIFLVVFILINGEWVPGETIDGWGPVEYSTLDECLERGRIFNKNTPDNFHSYCVVKGIDQ